jgi:hypothetical protein
MPSPALELALSPVAGRPGFYAADLGGCRVVAASRQPFLDAARALLALGVPPGAALAARHVGSAIVAMRSTVGEAAALAVEETDDRGLRLRRWRAHPKAACGGACETENARSDAAECEEPADVPRAFPAVPAPLAAAA